MDLGKQNDYYSDCKGATSTALENIYLSYAKNKGVKLYAGYTLGAQEQITVKKYSTLMVQFNEVIGLAVGYTNGNKYNAKMNTNLAVAPANYRDFKATIVALRQLFTTLKKMVYQLRILTAQSISVHLCIIHTLMR